MPIKKEIEEKKDLNNDKDTIYRKEYPIIVFGLYIIRFVLSMFILYCFGASLMMLYAQVGYLLSKFLLEDTIYMNLRRLILHN